MTVTTTGARSPTTPLLVIDEVKALLRVNTRTLYRLIKTGRLPAVKVGRQWRFRAADLDAWIDAQRLEQSH